MFLHAEKFLAEKEVKDTAKKGDDQWLSSYTGGQGRDT